MNDRNARNARRANPTRLGGPQFHLRRKATALAVAACFSTAAWANPTNPVVVHGTASFNQAGNILNVTNSHNAIINWGSFSIGVNELTRFIQPSALSAVLNRVTGSDPSAILGALQSNGRVFLLNPNGIVFGAGAQIDVAGLVASTLNLSNADFLAGRMNFTGGGPGAVLNQGAINAAGGPVYLVGSAVTNQGIITNPGGEIVLAAGNSVELVNPGTPNLRVEIQAGSNEARNLGSIVAQAGRIGIYAGLIRQGGVINADSAVSEGGRIILKSTQRTDLEAGSVTSARGTNGGQILALSDMSNGVTQVSGTLDASSNAVSAPGNGGFIDTSAASVKVADTAFVTAAARNGGQRGRWLIDPTDYVIASSGGDITGATLSASLGSTDVDVQSTMGGSILVNDSVMWNTNSHLQLLAYGGNITVNSAITNTGGGALKLYAGWDGASLTTPAISNGSDNTIFLNAPVSAGLIHLIAGGNIGQNALGVINAPELLVVNRNEGGVSLSAASNVVGTIAGRAVDSFSFKNSSNLVVGTVSAVQGIEVNGRNADFSFGGPGGAAILGLDVTAGTLTVNHRLFARGGDGYEGGAGGNATITLTASGSITTNDFVRAEAGAGGSNYFGTGGRGGNALVSFNAAGITINNGVSAQGGAGGGNASSGGGGAGGHATLNLTSTGAGNLIDIAGGGLTAHAGNGANGMFSGGSGGDASITVSSAGGIRIQSGLNAFGGAGAGGSNTGGRGGDAAINLSDTGTVGILADAGAITVNGGNGGYGLFVSGRGGDASVSLSTLGGISTSIHINIQGGNGAGDYWSSGNGGRGGDAGISMGAGANGITVDGGELWALAGTGGNGWTGGARGGNAEVSLGTTGGIEVSNVSMRAVAGRGGSAGGSSAGGGAGGQALVSLNAGSISVLSSSLLHAYGGNAGSGYAPTGATGGNGILNITATGNLQVQSSTLRATAGEGGYGADGYGNAGLASIQLSAYGGNMSIENSNVRLDGAEGGVRTAVNTMQMNASGNLTITDSTLDVQGGYYDGHGADTFVNLVSGGNVLIDSINAYIYGGGTNTAGALGGNAQLGISAPGAVTLRSSYINVNAGSSNNSGGGEGGGAVMLVSAGGSLALESGAYLFINGGSASSASGIGGGASLTLLSGGSINADGSEGHASGGYGMGGYGDAATTVLANGGISMVNYSEFRSYTSAAYGGSASASTLLAAAGPVSLNNSSRVDSSGGFVSVSGSSVTLNDYSRISGYGAYVAATAGDMTLTQNSYIEGYGGLNADIVAAGNLVVNTNSYIFGSPDVIMKVGGENLALASGGIIEADSPSTIHLTFTNGGGFTINGMSNITYDPGPPATGFIVNGAPAVLGSNFLVQVLTKQQGTLNVPVDQLVVAMSQSVPSTNNNTNSNTEDDKDKNKNKKSAMTCQ